MHEKTFGDIMPDENAKIQKITRLLEKGGTMLASHHECGAPLFRYQGKVLCPVCDFQEKQGGQEIRQKEEIKEERKVEKKPEEKPETTKRAVEQREVRSEIRPEIRPEISSMERSQAAEYHQIAALTRNKIYSIAASLENETDLQRVKEKMECIELGVKILKLLE